MPENKPIDQVGDAALRAVRAHGLCGRSDSPQEWNKALEGAKAGDPILVKDPDDPRDNFFLIPLIPKNPAAKRGVWVILDTQTLALREASLLENWKNLSFPDDNSDDAENISKQQHTLPDDTVTRFKKEDLVPNKNNLVWKASAASILPYWPLKEFTAPHPLTGESVSIYVTQDGKVYSQLLPDEEESPIEAQPPLKQHPPQPAKPSRALPACLAAACVGLLGVIAYLLLTKHSDTVEPPLTEEPCTHTQEIAAYKKEIDRIQQTHQAEIKQLTQNAQQVEKMLREKHHNEINQLKEKMRNLTIALHQKNIELNHYKSNSGKPEKPRSPKVHSEEILRLQKTKIALQAERERLLTRIHQVENGHNTRKDKQRLNVIENQLRLINTRINNLQRTKP